MLCYLIFVFIEMRGMLIFMGEVRKIVIFVFTAALFVYMMGRTFCSIKKHEFKKSLFAAMILGTGLITIGTFLDTLSIFTHGRYNPLIQIFFTLGGIVFIIGIVLWDNYIRITVAFLNKVIRTDPMTGVFNRRGLEEAFQITAKEKRTFFIVCFDLNDTKRINDKFGHLSGDKYIINSTKIISEEIGIRGVLARTGGDEFVALLWHINENEIEKIELAIKNKVNKIFIDQKTSISIGHAMYGREGKTLEQLIKIADLNMYEDKKSVKSIANF